MDISIKTTEFGAPAAAWVASAHKVHRPGGITIDKTAVDADSDGKRIVKGGTPVGFNATTGKFEPYKPATKGTLVIGTEAANNAILITAKTVGATTISVEFVDPDDLNKALTVTVAEKKISVSLATDADKAITSTAADVIAAIEAKTEAAALVDVDNSGASTGVGVVEAAEEAELVGGADINVTPSELLYQDLDCTTTDQAGGTLIHGVVLEARLPVTIDAVCKANLRGILFV